MQTVDHIAGETFHGRKGAVANAFRYSIDYVLCDAEATLKTPGLFGRNRWGRAALLDRDHGGAPEAGRGASWVRDVLAQYAIKGVAKVELLAQPRMFGHVFNPVSFWLCRDDNGALITVIAEVTNTYGDRHCYLCAHPDYRPILPQDRTLPEYEDGVSCHHCAGETSDDDKARFRERQKQIELARAGGEDHLAGPMVSDKTARS